MRRQGIDNRPVADTPVAVIDFETTGLTVGYDRVVEASVVRIDPGGEARLLFDSLINPGRSVAATEISRHGLVRVPVLQSKACGKSRIVLARADQLSGACRRRSERAEQASPIRGDGRMGNRITLSMLKGDKSSDLSGGLLLAAARL